MNTGKQMRSVLFAAIFALASVPCALAQSEISSFAFVQDDGSLKISGSLVRLYGIYIPPTDQSCYSFIRPVPCGSRASLALDFRISGAFVHCLPRATNPDGSITASCTVDKEDLSAWMLQKGWAVALPDAPFEYQTLEKIAQSRGIGIWGIPIDTLRRRKP